MYSYIFVIAILGMVIQGTFIAVEHKEKYVLADILKGLAAFMFVIIGFIGYNKVTTDTLGLKLLIGLIFGMVGDVVLNLRFILKEQGQRVYLVGIAAFLIGHIMYLAALIPLDNNLLMDIIAGVILAAALLAYIFKTLEVKPIFKIFGIVYLGAVFIMSTIAVHLAIVTQNAHDVIYAVGAVFFTMSDIVLIFNQFSGVSKFSRRIVNLSMYYIGQLLIAGSLFICR